MIFSSELLDAGLDIILAAFFFPKIKFGFFDVFLLLKDLIFQLFDNLVFVGELFISQFDDLSELIKLGFEVVNLNFHRAFLDLKFLLQQLDRILIQFLLTRLCDSPVFRELLHHICIVGAPCHIHLGNLSFTLG